MTGILRTTSNGLKSVFCAALLLGLVAAPALAQEGTIKHRQSIMKAVGGHVGAMAAILKGEVGFKEDLKGHAHALAELAKIAPKIFPKDSDFGDTAALPEIWAKPDEFKKDMDAFQAESAKLAKVAESGDMNAFKAQFDALGKNACGACHKTFRKKKN